MTSEANYSKTNQEADFTLPKFVAYSLHTVPCVAVPGPAEGGHVRGGLPLLHLLPRHPLENDTLPRNVPCDVIRLRQSERRQGSFSYDFHIDQGPPLPLIDSMLL